LFNENEYSVIEDKQLVARALAGSQDAYREIVDRYQRPIYSLVIRMVRDPSAAEDLAQEVFCKAFRALGSFDHSRKFSSWLFKIAHNAAIDQLRKRRVPTISLEIEDAELNDPLRSYADPNAEDPDESLKRQEMAHAIESSLDSLRPEYREILVLRFEQEKSYEEISEITELPLGTVKTHLHRARKALAGDLSKKGWNPGK
jgi:RNA polymerase sigma-70 factor (ECF subfamily)